MRKSSLRTHQETDSRVPAATDLRSVGARVRPGVQSWFCCLLGVLLMLSFSESQAQKSKQQLEREKKQNLKKIAETSKILKETAEQKEASIGHLSALQQQISSRTQLINSISGEVGILDREMHELNQITTSMERDLNNLKKEYASMVYAASKATSTYNKLLFLFSAPTFNQVVMRFKYLQQYAEARKNQVKQIDKIRITLNTQREKLNIKKRQKQNLLDSQISENQNLLVLKQKQDQVVEQLSQREVQLKEEMEESEKAVNRLEKLITDLVEEEIRKAAEAEARRVAREKANREREEANAERAERVERTSEVAEKTEKADKNTITLTPETAALASSFASSKSKLIWPVRSGFISSKFGKHEHAVLKGVYVENLGVNIQTNKGEFVRAVYDGVVSSVANIPGLNRMVAVQHGDYITVYANLSKVNVKMNQKVKAKDVLGEVYTDKDGVSQLQFQIWKNYDKLDPEAWLYEK